MDDKDRAIELLIEKSNLINETFEVFFERFLESGGELNSEETEIFEKYNKRNPEILEELVKLGYAQEIKQ
jgi:hypothetical protein